MPGIDRSRAAAAEDVMVAMRDGVRLHTRIWKSQGEGPHAIVLTRGYRPGSDTDAARFTEAGYVYVGQSTRGHARSEGTGGVRNRFLDDAEDGYDALSWIAAQPWSDGNIAMYGKSYWGKTQWLVAVENHPNLKAIIPQCIDADSFRCGYWCNGALSLAMTARGRAYDRSHWECIDEIGWMEYFRHLPLINLDEVVGGARDEGAAELWKDYLTHSTFDDYWRRIGIRADGADGKYEHIRIPVYLMTGWYDYYPGAAFASFQRLREVDATPEIRIAINPCDHLNRIVGDREFGPDASKDEVALAIRWLDHVLKGRNNGVQDEPPIRIFVMGKNEWRFEHQWPLPGTEFTPYYFHSEDGSRVGTLGTSVPNDETPTVYVYDPADPVPTLGGNHSFSDSNIPDIIRAGAVDQRPNQGRSDVLVFTSAPMTEDTEVIGPVAVKLYVSSSAPDTDFVAMLIDVHPDGTAYNLTQGILRTRFRVGLYEPSKLMRPGELYELDIELFPTSNVFKEAHRIEVHVTSSNFPLWDRNLNTGGDPATDGEMRAARQTVFHDAKRPSHIVLPVIGKNR